MGELVEDHLDRTLALWVYNSEFDVVRTVDLVPTRGWGGEGALGAELGFGALHRLPVGLGEEVEGPGEVVFETRPDGFSTPVPEPASSIPNTEAAGVPGPPPQFLVPANMTSPPAWAQGTAAASQGSQHGRKSRGNARASPQAAFDDYFAEGEQKSKEQDHVPSRRGTPLPPPPKVGQPQEPKESE